MGVNDGLDFFAIESGAEAAAVQTLREFQTSESFAKRLECGAFTAAFFAAKKLNFTKTLE